MQCLETGSIILVFLQEDGKYLSHFLLGTLARASGNWFYWSCAAIRTEMRSLWSVACLVAPHTATLDRNCSNSRLCSCRKKEGLTRTLSLQNCGVIWTGRTLLYAHGSSFNFVLNDGILYTWPRLLNAKTSAEAPKTPELVALFFVDCRQLGVTVMVLVASSACLAYCCLKIAVQEISIHWWLRSSKHHR